MASDFIETYVNQDVLRILGKELTPRFLTVEELRVINERVTGDSGSISGVRDIGGLESAAHRPINLASYGEKDIGKIVASLTFGLVKNHAFIDGNKRTAFFALSVFLEGNGIAFEPELIDAVNAITALADSSLSEDEFARWVNMNSYSPGNDDTEHHFQRKPK